MPTLEILAVLADEVREAEASLASTLADFAAGPDTEQGRDAGERYAEQVQRIGAAAEVLRLGGLKQVCGRVETNLAALDAREIVPAQLTALGQWPGLVLDYLVAPKDPLAWQSLIRHFQQSLWPLPLTEAEAEALAQQLAEAPDDGPDAVVRAATAQVEDIALDIPADINPALIEAFLAEGPAQAAHYGVTIQRVIRGEIGAESVNEARRVVHTIKGAANTVGVRGVAALTHHLEDVLEHIAEHGLRPQGGLAKLLVDAGDCLEMMFESLLETTAAPPQALSVLQQLLDAANRIDRGEPLMDRVANEPAAIAAPATATSAPEVRVEPKIRVAAKAVDEMLRLSGEMTVARAHVQERLHHALQLLAELREHAGLAQRRSGELESLVMIQGVAAGQRQATTADGDFDALEMDQYSEMHGAVHGFVETISDLQTLGNRILDAMSAVDTAVTQEGLTNSELHEQIMRARMVAVSAIEPRLQRTVRQVCDATGKQATLNFSGSDVMLDDQVINALIDPLMHIVRNAVDHGIETPEVRTAAGKPAAGTLSLAFSRVGSHIVIQCADDGAGLDLPRIHGTAVARGVIDDSQPLDDADIARLILLPGFSTHDTASEISGRGVGMDIVHTNVRKLKGHLDIQTRSGQGTTFTLRLPITLGTAHCLLIECGGELVAIPSDALDHAVYLGEKNIQRLGAQWTYRDERNTCAVDDLAHLLGFPAQRRFGERGEPRTVLIVNGMDGKRAVVVDALLSGRDLVIKSPGRHLANLSGVVGASLLGDGRVVPVLDMHDLLNARRHAGEHASLSANRPARPMRSSVSDILVVDDSLSVRQALSQLLNSEGYQVRTAKDGVEALELIDKAKPAALVVDLEMPRMNGLELTSRLRARDDTLRLPVIMVTSRSSDKHRTQAQRLGVDLYLTKPYRENDLLAQLRGMLSKAA